MSDRDLDFDAENENNENFMLEDEERNEMLQEEADDFDFNPQDPADTLVENKPQPHKEHKVTDLVQMAMDYVYYVYEDVSGYIQYKPGEKQEGEKSKAYLTYGEILPLSLDYIIQKLNIGPEDVFYDLGSGIGKVGLQVFMTTPVQHCFGVEFNKLRNDMALVTRARVKRDLPELFVRHGEERILEYKQGNMLEHDYSNGTFMFTCSTCFGEDLMQGIAELTDQFENIRYLLTLKPAPCKRLPLKLSIPIDCTWDTSTCHIYTLEDLKSS